MLLLTHPILECSLRDLTFEQKKICPPWNWKLTLLAMQWLRCLSFEVALLIIRVKENDNAFVRDIGLDASLFSASDKRSHMEYWNLTKHNFFRQTSLPLCHCFESATVLLCCLYGKGFITGGVHCWLALEWETQVNFSASLRKVLFPRHAMKAVSRLRLGKHI